MGEEAAHAVEGLLKDLERAARPVQAKSFICFADCLKNDSWSEEQVASCIQRCQTSTQKLNELIEVEISDFESRLTRCGASCQDRIRDKLPMNEQPNSAQMNQLQTEMNNCFSKCTQEHLPMVNKMREKLLAHIAKMK